MIALQRVRTNEAVKAKYRGTKRLNQERKLMLQQRDFLLHGSSLAFDTGFWKDAKNQLKKETCGKCAYCEANVSVVAHGDVEHYRPKSVYWWLAYSYDNYLYVCQICNQLYKKDHFPTKGTRWTGPPLNDQCSDAECHLLADTHCCDPLDIDFGYTLAKLLKDHKKERPYLLNPYWDDPAIYFAYRADDVLKEVSVVPKASKYKMYVEAAEEYYGINRIELKNLRYNEYTKFTLIKECLTLAIGTPHELPLQEYLNTILSNNNIFSGMLTYFHKKG